MNGRRNWLRASAVAMVALGFASSAAAQDVVKIGYTGPLSGGAALYGKNVLSGIEMAVAEINAGGLTIGGRKVKLEVVALDDKYSPAESAINARRLVQQEKTPAVFVPHSGGIFALQAFNEKDNFLLMAYSSVPRITEVGNKLTIRIPPMFTAYIDPFIRRQMQKYGKNVGLAPADHDYAKAWVQAFAPAWEKAGGTIVANNPMSYNRATDFSSGVSRVLAAKPDVMFVGGASEPTALVVKQARELGFKGGFILMDQAKLDEMAAVTGGLQMLEGAIGVLPVSSDMRPGAQAFVAAYRKSNANATPTSEASLNYTMVHALAAAMQRAGTATDPAKIRAAFDEAVKSLPQARNPNEITRIEANGGTSGDTPVAVVENGQIKQVRLSELLK